MKIVAMAATMPTYYDVLQVERDATPERVRAAYRKLAQTDHPVKLPANANAVLPRASINADYDVPSHEHRPAEHDLWIRRAERIKQPVPAAAALPKDLWTYLHPATHWPWYLLFGTLVVALGTVATAMYLTAMPARAASYPAAQPCVQQAAPADAAAPCRRRT